MYDELPPVVVAVIEVVPPFTIIVPDVNDNANAVGSPTVTDSALITPFASVTLYVYVPADTVNVPVPVYGAVPPVAETTNVVLPPLQAIVPAVAVALNNDEGCVIVIVPDFVQPLASFTVMVCVPATTDVNTLLAWYVPLFNW